MKVIQLWEWKWVALGALLGAILGATGLLTNPATAVAATKENTASAAKTASCPALLNHAFTNLQGKRNDLCQYAGQVILVVNTASQCGFTKQYEGLQALHDKYQAQGLTVLGFPANDFGQQEPGSDAEVADFCERKFRVKFPMMSKSSVVEGSANPLYEALAKATGQRPKWNFHKYLIDRDGKAVGSFGSRVEPTSAELQGAIEKHLSHAQPAHVQETKFGK
jgi:glutathione peroxidase